MELHFEDSNMCINIRNEKYSLSFWHKHLILRGVPVTHLEIFMIARDSKSSHFIFTGDTLERRLTLSKWLSSSLF